MSYKLAKFYVQYLKPEPMAEFLLVMKWMLVITVAFSSQFFLLYGCLYFVGLKYFSKISFVLLPILAATSNYIFVRYYIPTQKKAIESLSIISRARLKKATTGREKTTGLFYLICTLASLLLAYKTYC